MKNGGLLVALCGEDLALFLTLCNEDLARLFSLCAQNCLTALTLCLHLLLHRVLNLGRGKNVLELNAVYFDAPCVGGFVEDNSDFCVDDIARSQRVVKLHFADDVSQRCCREIFDSGYRALHAVCIELRVGYLEENDRVYLHRDVIFCDNGLGREIHNLLLEGDGLRYFLNERYLEVDAGLPCGRICAEALDDIGLGLRHYLDVEHDNNEHEHDYADDYSDCYRSHNNPPLVF